MNNYLNSKRAYSGYLDGKKGLFIGPLDEKDLKSFEQRLVSRFPNRIGLFKIDNEDKAILVQYGVKNLKKDEKYLLEYSGSGPIEYLDTPYNIQKHVVVDVYSVALLEK